MTLIINYSEHGMNRSTLMQYS